MRRLAAVLVVACLGSTPLPAQVEPTIVNGSLVRIKTLTGPDEWIVGVVGGVDVTRIWVGERAVARASIRRIEVSGGRKAQTGKGALLGALAGLAIGGVVGLARGEVSDDPITPPVMAVIGTGAGAIVGALIGAGSRAESWRRIDDSRIAVVVLPATQGGATLRLAMTF